MRKIKELFRKGFLVILLGVMILIFVPNIVYAEGNNLTLEKSHEWTTGDYSYAMGVAAADIDNDDAIEIVTVGYYYNSTGVPSANEGELDIWSWNGTDLKLEHTELYEVVDTWSSDTRLYDVALGNLDNDTEIEIVAVGYGKFLDVEEFGLLIVGSWNGSSYIEKAIQYFPEGEVAETKAFGVALGDVDKDNVTEIIVVGYENTTTLSTGFHGQITIWNMTGGKLNLETSWEWRSNGDAIWRSVVISDVDLDGEDEILIAGDFYDSSRDFQCAILRICSWDGESLEWEVSRQWYTYSDTYCQAIAVGNLDSDGIPDIVTLGYQMDSERFYVQLRIWNWKDELLTLKFSGEGGVVVDYAFLTNFGTSVAIGDIDGDKTNEIIVGVQVWALFSSTATLRIFAWDGQTLSNEGGEDWIGSSIIEDSVCLDVDSDGGNELVTVGYAAGMMIPPKSTMGIWSVTKFKSKISLKLNFEEITIGDQVIISGQLSNETGDTPIQNAKIEIEFEHEHGGFQPLATVETDENGEFSYSWIPSNVGQYTVRASWNGDFQHEGASDTATLTVKKASSMITLVLSSYVAEVGKEVSVDGTLYPAQEAAITLEYRLPDNTVTTKIVNSNTEGKFTDSFVANQAGEWHIKAIWNGNELYTGTESQSVPLTVTKKESELSIDASALTINVGENVTISGKLEPGQTATITLTYVKPDGTTITEQIQTDSTGSFNYAIKLDQAGAWQITASWSGNGEYAATASNSISVLAQPSDVLTQIMTMVGPALGVIALIISIAAMYLASRRKTASSPPSVPTTST